MLKVIHIVPTFELGGVQTGIVFSLMELRKEIDYKVLVVGKTDMNWMKTIPINIRENILTTGTNEWIAGSIKALRILRDTNPDIIINSLWKSVPTSIIYKAINPRVKLIAFHHTARFVHLANYLSLKLLTLVCNQLIADSEATSGYIKKIYSKKNVSVVPYYFPVKHQVYSGKNIHHGKIKIVYFGRFKPEKGISRSIRFCAKLKELGADFHFDLFGEGLESRYQEEINKLNLSDRIHLRELLSPVSVGEKMDEYDFLLQLSDHEGMAAAVVEAMGHGLVPIVTPVGEIANYSRDGYNAIWLKDNFEDNLFSLAEKVIQVSKKPQLFRSLSENASKTFDSKNSYIESLIGAIQSNFQK
jgi:glycosyltransferase involved in cell wall biosynthesis